MCKIISLGLSSILVALLASANAIAETRITPVYGTPHASDEACKLTGQQSTVSECIKGKDSKGQKTTANADGESRSRVTTRVYLDHYQRLPQTASKHYRTTPLVLGRNKKSN